MKKRLFALSLSLLLLMTLLSGCGSSADGNTSSAASADLMMDSGAAYDTAAAETTEAAAAGAVFASDRAASTNSSGVPAALQNAKVILRANLDAETREFDEADTSIQALIDKLGGYIESSSVEGSAGYRYASYTVRVPRAQYETFLEQVGTLCSVTYRSRSAEDVSEQYFDRETRLKAQTTKRDRLLALLEKAEKMEDIIQLESALADVQVEIEALTGELRHYDSLVDFSTIYLSLREVRDLSDVPEESSFLSDVKLTFRRSLRGIVDFAQGLVLLFVGGWPVLVFAAVVIWIVLRVVKRRRAKKSAVDAFFTPVTPNYEEKPKEDDETPEE